MHHREYLQHVLVGDFKRLSPNQRGPERLSLHLHWMPLGYVLAESARDADQVELDYQRREHLERVAIA
jgi:hypothetical protein